ncbi:unnamed protein product [Closterium sp. NIES-64]|nr:unnamed protein product [Closterium sp. NIES-64]
MWCSLELACLVQQLLAPDAPPSASVPLTPNFDSAPPAKPPAAATAESGAVAAAAAAADVADGAAEGGVGVSARGDSSSSSANGGCSSEESGGSGFKRAYWHACTNVERFLKVSDGLSSKSPRVSEALVRPLNSERAYWHACTNVERFLKVCRRVGLRDVSLFTSPDLVDGRDDQHLLTPMSPVIPPLFPRSSPSVPLVSLPFSPETLSVPPCPPCPPPLPVSSRCAYLSPQVCRRVGLRDVSLFTSPDLVDGRDVRRVCLCLRTLSKRLVGIRDFDGIMTERKEQQQQKQFTQATATESLDSEPPDSDALSSTNRETGVSSGRESSVQGDSATGAAAVTGAAGAAGAAGLASHGYAAESQNAPAWFGLKEDERRSMAGAIPAGLPSLRVHGRPVGERPDHLSSPRRVASPLSRTHSNASSTSTALHSTHSLSRHSYTRGSHRSHSHALGLVGEGEGEQRRRGVWDLVAAAGAVALVGGAMVLANRSNRRTREERRRRALEYERPSFTDHIAQRPHLGMGFGGVFELNFGDTPVAAAATDAPDGEGAEGIEGGMERGRAGGRDGGREGGADLAAGEEERAGLGRREARRPWFMSLGSQRNSTSTGEARSTTSTTGSSSNATSSSGGWRRGPKPLPRWQQAELVLRQQREMVIRRLHGDRRSMAEICRLDEERYSDLCRGFEEARRKEERAEGSEGGECRGSTEGGVYEVQEGDTLSTIADKFRQSVGEVLRRNPQIKDPDAIYPHDRLVL